MHYGVTLWHIGTLDRTATEFRDGNNARDFQMFKRYPKEFPDDVTFTIEPAIELRIGTTHSAAIFVRKPARTIQFQSDGRLSARRGVPGQRLPASSRTAFTDGAGLNADAFGLIYRAF